MLCFATKKYAKSILVYLFLGSMIFITEEYILQNDIWGKNIYFLIDIVVLLSQRQ